jgi:hypothetical protein
MVTEKVSALDGLILKYEADVLYVKLNRMYTMHFPSITSGNNMNHHIIFRIILVTFKKSLIWIHGNDISKLDKNQGGSVSDQRNEQRTQKLEFNIFVGWAIHSIIQRLSKRKDQLDENLQVYLTALQHLRHFNHDMNPSELADLPRYWAILNKGGLCCPVPALSQFGNRLFHIISFNINVARDGNAAINNIWNLLFKDYIGAWTAIFQAPADKDIKENRTIEKRALRDIISKVCHVRCQVAVKAFRDANFSRYVAKSSGAIFQLREQLKITAGGKGRKRKAAAAAAVEDDEDVLGI